MGKKNEKKFQPVQNSEMYAAMFAKRTSGAAGFHGDRRLKRLRDRSASNRNAISDQSR